MLTRQTAGLLTARAPVTSPILRRTLLRLSAAAASVSAAAHPSHVSCTHTVVTGSQAGHQALPSWAGRGHPLSGRHNDRLQNSANAPNKKIRTQFRRARASGGRGISCIIMYLFIHYTSHKPGNMNLNENVFRQDLQKQKWIINIQLTQTRVFSLNIIYSFKKSWQTEKKILWVSLMRWTIDYFWRGQKIHLHFYDFWCQSRNACYKTSTEANYSIKQSGRH